MDELAAYSGFPTEGRFIDNVAALPGFYKNTEKNESNAKAEAPRRYTDRNGNLVQPVPTDELGGTTPTSTPTTAAAPRATRWRTR